MSQSVRNSPDSAVSVLGENNASWEAESGRNRHRATRVLEEAKEAIRAKEEAGYRLVRTPIMNGYSEKWVK